MITFSSNANTDYLIDLLGISAINELAASLGLTQHEPVYPLVGALLIPEFTAADELETIPMETYRQLAIDLSRQLKEGTIIISSYTFDLPLDVQRIWSDRLIGASAKDYGKLLSVITNDELPNGAAEVIRDVMEWPMEVNAANQDFYAHLGAKGGSTAFILNDALYAETLVGEKIEIVIFTDQLNLWQSLMLGHQLNSFEENVISSEEYRLKVKETLEDSMNGS